MEARLDSVFDSNSDDGQSGRVCCNCLNELQRLNKLKGNLECKIKAGIEGILKTKSLDNQGCSTSSQSVSSPTVHQSSGFLTMPLSSSSPHNTILVNCVFNIHYLLLVKGQATPSA